jgi:predicted aldo/keto reductase-like oxidoreductase
MPVLSCGGMRYQQSWSDMALGEIEPAGQENLEQTIHRSLDLGINHIETARGYGTSEMQLGCLLPSLDRDKMIVQTKVEPKADPKDFLKEFETSMSYLKLDYIDLLGMHGINHAEMLDWTLKAGGCLDVARQLQKEGRVRHIGFSTHAPHEVVLEAVESDAFDYVNLHWYFIYQRTEEAVRAAASRDMGVFIISPSDKGGLLYQPSEKLSEYCAPLSPIAFNNLFCLSRSEICTLSIGAARPGDFDEHVQSLKHYDEASDVSSGPAERMIREVNKQCGDQWWDSWWQGIPSFTEIPGQINVRAIVRLWTWAKAMDMIEYGKMRYNLIGNAGHWFPGERAVTLPSRQALMDACPECPHKDRLYDILREAHDMLGGEQRKRLSQS